MGSELLNDCVLEALNDDAVNNYTEWTYLIKIEFNYTYFHFCMLKKDIYNLKTTLVVLSKWNLQGYNSKNEWF